MNICDGIHNWAYIIARVQGAVGCGYQEDWLGMSANLAGGIGKAVWYSRNQIPSLKDAIKKVHPTATYIVDIAMVITQFLDFLNGFWIPDNGDVLARGEEKFKNVYYTLLLSYPDDNQWSGEKEQHYAKLNLAQQDQAQTMQKLDAQLREIVHKQAVEVESAHTFIALTLMGLLLAQGIALALCLIPGNGSVISWRFQMGVAISAVGGVLAKEMYTMTESIARARDAEELADQYDEVAAAARLSGAYGQAEVAMANSAVATVEPIFENVSDFAGLANVAGEHAFSAPFANGVRRPQYGAPGWTPDEPMSATAAAPAELAHPPGWGHSDLRAPARRRRNSVSHLADEVRPNAAVAQDDQHTVAPSGEAAAEGAGFGAVALAPVAGKSRRAERETKAANP